MTDLKDKVIVVVGASSGMGQATAIELARQGAKVICAARRPEQGEKTLAEIRALGGEGDFVRTDIADSNSVAALFAFIENKYGRLDGAFNNAGIENSNGNLPDITLESFDELMTVNVRGTFNCMQHEMRIMREKKNGGSIVNTSSTAGVMGLSHCSAYVTSKWAVVGMSKSAALDGTDYGVRVNVICPGVIDTDMFQRWTKGDPQAIEHMTKLSPMGRLGTPQEIADVTAWLLSSKSSFVNGLVMPVDGGIAAGKKTR